MPESIDMQRLNSHRPVSNPLVSLLIALAIVLLVNSAAWACPNCKEAMAAQDPSHGGLVKGYFYSILFMMGTPYLLLCLWGAWVYRSVKKSRAAKQAAPIPPSPAPAEIGEMSSPSRDLVEA